MTRRFPKVEGPELELTQQPPEQLHLPDGRRLAYDLRGDPEGQPVFWFHGSPSGRLEGILLERFGRDEGFNFIVSDRPGLGASSPHPGWSMASYASDVEQLADHLGLERFSVAGGSGGGPFVLALAAHCPQRIDRAVSLACAGAFEHEDARAVMGWVDALAAWAVRRAPALVQLYFTTLSGLARTPEFIARWGGRVFAPGGQPDFAVLFLRVLRESSRPGTAGLIRDTEVLHRGWGFALEDIPIPVDLVNGTRDEFVGLGYGKVLSRRIPQSRLHIAERDDHFRTIFDLDRLERLLRT